MRTDSSQEKQASNFPSIARKSRKRFTTERLSSPSDHSSLFYASPIAARTFLSPIEPLGNPTSRDEKRPYEVTPDHGIMHQKASERQLSGMQVSTDLRMASVCTVAEYASIDAEKASSGTKFKIARWRHKILDKGSRSQVTMRLYSLPRSSIFEMAKEATSSPQEHQGVFHHQ